VSTITVTTDQGINFQFPRFFGAGTSQGSGTLRCADGDTLFFFGAGATYSTATFFESVGGQPEEWATITGFSVPSASLEDPNPDSFESALGSILFYGGRGDDTIVLGGGVDTVYGGAGNDVLAANYRNYGGGYLFGGSGNDTFIALEGVNFFSGGAGSDTIDLSKLDLDLSRPNSQLGVGIDLRLTKDQQLKHFADEGDWSAYVRLHSVENVEGTRAKDVITGNSAENTLRGNDGDDVLAGGFGSDVLDGGAGFDFVSYRWDTPNIIVRLANTGPQYVGAAGYDQLISIEGAIGGKGADVLVGNSVANRLFGMWGGDTLNGGGGRDSLRGDSGDDLLVGGLGGDTLNGGWNNDTLDGGAGTDYLIGGAGRTADNADRFVFRSAAEADGDVIQDFNGAEGDRIDLHLIDASAGADGDQAFSFIGAIAFSGVAGQLRFESTSTGSVQVMGDTNGDALADFQITLEVVVRPPTLSDFLL
jgi:Ca2+-binding RTX toxin-like protein